MRTFYFYLLLLSICNAQSSRFRYLESNVNDVVFSSSLWLSNTLLINPLTYSRFTAQIGFSTIPIKEPTRLWTYPNFDFGFRLTKNLSITSKAYGYVAEEDAPQVIGGGLQYYFGSQDAHDWSLSLQRTDLLGLEYYNLKSLNFDLGKWFSYNTNSLKVSFGTNLFDGVAFKVPIDQKKYFDGKFNYVAVTVLRPFMFFDIGIGLKFSSKNSTLLLHTKKDFN